MQNSLIVIPKKVALDTIRPAHAKEEGFFWIKTIDECKEVFKEYSVSHLSVSVTVCDDNDRWRHLFLWIVLHSKKMIITPPQFWRVYWGPDSFRYLMNNYMNIAHSEYEKSVAKLVGQNAK